MSFRDVLDQINRDIDNKAGRNISTGINSNPGCLYSLGVMIWCIGGEIGIFLGLYLYFFMGGVVTEPQYKSARKEVAALTVEYENDLIKSKEVIVDPVKRRESENHTNALKIRLEDSKKKAASIKGELDFYTVCFAFSIAHAIIYRASRGRII